MEKNLKKILIFIPVLILIITILIILLNTNTENTKTNKNDINNIQKETEDTTNESEDITSKVEESQNKTITTEDTTTSDYIQSNIVTAIEETFKYVHNVGGGPYCGTRNTNSYIVSEESEYIRYEESNFKNKQELNEYLKTFMSNDVINKYSSEGKYSVPSYKEQDGKLYCLNSNKGCGIVYNSSCTTFSVINETENSMTIKAKFCSDKCGSDDHDYINATIEINNEIVTKYIEE